MPTGHAAPPVLTATTISHLSHPICAHTEGAQCVLIPTWSWFVQVLRLQHRHEAPGGALRRGGDLGRQLRPMQTMDAPGGVPCSQQRHGTPFAPHASHRCPGMPFTPHVSSREPQMPQMGPMLPVGCPTAATLRCDMP